MYKGNNIVKDFEAYLTKSGIWTQWEDIDTRWIHKLGEQVDTAAKRTACENSKLEEKDVLWWIFLLELQQVYGYSYDIFGAYIEEKGMTSQRNGQFLTPMSICEIMAAITIKERKEVKKNKECAVSVSDCACGTGRMMIGHSETVKKHPGYTPIDYIYYNQDVDYKMFIFTTLNASLRNLYSVNTWGDSLAVKNYKTYITIPTSLGVAAWYDKEHEVQRSNQGQEEKEAV